MRPQLRAGSDGVHRLKVRFEHGLLDDERRCWEVVDRRRVRYSHHLSQARVARVVCAGSVAVRIVGADAAAVPFGE